MPYDWHYDFTYSDGTTAAFTVTTESTLSGSGYNVLSITGSYRGYVIQGLQEYHGLPNQLGLGSEYFDGIGIAGPLSMDLGNYTGVIFYNQDGRIFSQDGTNLPRANYPVVNNFSTSACFVRGTLILTPQGYVPVQELHAGDLVVVHDKDVGVVKWVGRAIARPIRHPRRHEVDPIRILAGAIADNVPCRDLLVSPGHAVLFENVLINAGDLVNGATIVQEERDTVDYYHVELDQHDIVIAEGLACESYLDDGNRASFLNGSDHIRAHGRIDRGSKKTCRPLVTSGPLLVTARSAILACAAELGWRLGERPRLRIAVDRQTIEPTAVSGDRYWFAVPPGTNGDLRLQSAAAIANRIKPSTADDRRLGVAVAELRIDGEAIPLTSSTFGPGFYPIEQEATMWRWTNGDGSLLINATINMIEVRLQMIFPVLYSEGREMCTEVAS